MGKARDDYLAMRQRFEPVQPVLAVVAESPPKSGKYFYDPCGSAREQLFSAFMNSLGEAPATKEARLHAFCNRGWVLVDATYEPVNGLGPRERDEVIRRDYPLLLADLKRLAAERALPVVLVKSNVRAVLEPLLQQGGFEVLNRGRAIYFPGSGRQRQFQEQFAAVVGGAGLL